MRYSAAEIAAACGISTASFYNWIKRNKELKEISELDKENTVVNGANTVSFGVDTLNAFIAEAKRRGKTVRQGVDNTQSSIRESENPAETEVEEFPSESVDKAQSKDTPTFDKAAQALIDELKAQNEYLKQKLDDALEDNRNYAQAMVRMSANLVYLQGENKRLMEAQTPAEEAQTDGEVITIVEEVPKEDVIEEQAKTTQTEQKPSIWQKIKNKWGKK